MFVLGQLVDAEDEAGLGVEVAACGSRGTSTACDSVSNPLYRVS